MTLFSNQVNGHAVPGTEHLTSNIDYFTISTPVDIVNATLMTSDPVDGTYGAPAGSTATHANLQTALDKLIEIIAQRGQPVIMGTPTGTGPYTFRFATEHYSSWAVLTAPPSGGYGAGAQDQTTLATAAASALQSAIIAAGKDYGFDANTTVTVSSSL